jgi:hypothetical protein
MIPAARFGQVRYNFHLPAAHGQAILIYTQPRVVKRPTVNGLFDMLPHRLDGAHLVLSRLQPRFLSRDLPDASAQGAHVRLIMNDGNVY